MKVFWSRCGHGHGNFGDKLTPLLLTHFGVPVEWAPPEHADLIGIGSILEKVSENFKGTIWSSGFMHAETRRGFPKARILAVRGRLSLQRVNGAVGDHLALGDAGLLCDEFLQRGARKHKLGVIPHFVDAADPMVKQFVDSSPDIKLIDICGEAIQVMREVSECEHVLSSSLHGLILADSLGIPNRWLELNHGPEIVEGRGFKYHDYYSVFDLQPEPLHLERSLSLDAAIQACADWKRPGIDGIKAGLRATLQTIRDQVRPVSAAEAAAKRAAMNEWVNNLAELKKLVTAHLPAGAMAVVADDDQFRHELTMIRALPFLDRDGAYWGPPGTGTEAIAEITRQLEAGAEWVVIAWPMFWLLDSFADFRVFLEERFRFESRTKMAMILRKLR